MGTESHERVKRHGLPHWKSQDLSVDERKPSSSARKKRSTREFVRFTQPLPFESFEKLEMDIKFIYIRGERRNALLLTILDTFTGLFLPWNDSIASATRMLDECLIQ